MFGVHEQTDEIVTVQGQAEKDPKAHVVNAALHGAVHGFCVVGVIALRSFRMQELVLFLVVRFLKELIGSNARLMKFFVVFNGGSGNIDVDAPDGPVFMFDRIDGVDALENVFNRIVARMFACLKQQPFVSHILKCNDFTSDLFLSELFTNNVLIFGVIGTIHTGVHAVVGKVKRSKEHDAVAVNVFFDFFSRCKNLIV